ncbi:MAG: YaiI/YqxD family protein [Candidatus Izemoplasmatales bacterium]
MKILIDADASPVKNIIIQVAKIYSVPVIIVSNFNHRMESDYAKIITVDEGRDVADHEIINNTLKGDLVVTQDYGLASLVLMKKADCMHQNGWFYTNDNIDGLLMQRQISQKIRRSKQRNTHIAKRTEKDNEVFEKKLDEYLKSRCQN